MKDTALKIPTPHNHDHGRAEPGNPEVTFPDAPIRREFATLLLSGQTVERMPRGRRNPRPSRAEVGFWLKLLTNEDVDSLPDLRLRAEGDVTGESYVR